MYWLDQHSGSVMAVLTLVYVIATFGILWVNARTNRLTSKSIETMVNLEKERARPHVIVDLYGIHFMPHLVVKNIGHTGAYDLSITMQPALKSVRGVVKVAESKGPREEYVDISIIKAPIAFLAPGREIRAFVAPWERIRTEMSPDLKFSGELRYKRQDGFQYHEAFKLDLNYVMGLAGGEETDIGHELAKLRESVDKLAQSMRRT